MADHKYISRHLKSMKSNLHILFSSAHIQTWMHTRFKKVIAPWRHHSWLTVSEIFSENEVSRCNQGLQGTWFNTEHIIIKVFSHSHLESQIKNAGNISTQ